MFLDINLSDIRNNSSGSTMHLVGAETQAKRLSNKPVVTQVAGGRVWTHLC